MNEVTNDTSTNGKGLLAVFGAVVLVALGVGAYLFFGGGASEEVGGDAVAIVNGTAIYRDALDRSLEQISNSYAAQGIDVTGAEAEAAMREQALTALIDRQLLVGAAEAAGITASDEAVEAEYQNALDNLGGAENLAIALAGIGMTEEDLRTDLAKDVAINRYLEERLELQSVTASDEEVETAYDAAVEANDGELPALEDVRELIRGQLVMEKQQQLILTELERLRAEADIERLV